MGKGKLDNKDVKKILIIKHGALGDMILSTGPFAAIRKEHKDAHITLLTKDPYHLLAKEMPFFNEIWLDDKPKPWQIEKCKRLLNRIKEGGFDRVYDLQTSTRSSMYYRFLGRKKTFV